MKTSDAVCTLVVLVVVIGAAWYFLGSTGSEDSNEERIGNGTFTLTALPVTDGDTEYSGTLTVRLENGEMASYRTSISTEQVTSSGNGDVDLDTSGSGWIQPTNPNDPGPVGTGTLVSEIRSANPYLSGSEYKGYHTYTQGSTKVTAYIFSTGSGLTFEISANGDIYGVVDNTGDISMRFVRNGWTYSS